MALLVTLITKYCRPFITFVTQRLCALWVWNVRDMQIVRGSGSHIACVFAQQCVQLASESASGQAKGRTVHQRIHRTTECFPGGGWDSGREGSKKSLSNYLQLWACFCAVSHTFFIVAQDVIAYVIRFKVYQWLDNYLRSCKIGNCDWSKSLPAHALTAQWGWENWGCGDLG